MPWKIGKRPSILEFVISGMILTVGILGITPFLGVQTLGTDLTAELQDANEIAQIEIENMMQSSDWGQLPYNSGPDSTDPVYIVTRTIKDINSDQSIPSGYARLNIRITWIGQDDNEHAVDYAVLKPYLGYFGQDNHDNQEDHNDSGADSMPDNKENS